MTRAAMAVAILATLAAGQYIEKYIPLPDSFGSIYGGYFALDTARGRLFLGGAWERFVLVLDPATGQRIGRVDLAAPCERVPGGRFGYNPYEYKLYYSGFDTTAGEWRLFVQDIAAGSLLANIEVGTYATGFLCNPVSNKVYCLAEDFPQGLLVIDGQSDSVLARLDVESDSPPAMAFSTVTNRLYVPDGGDLVVIDGATDSVVARVPVQMETRSAFWDSVNNTVVLLDSRNTQLKVVDCATNRVVAECYVNWHETVSAAFNGRSGRVYCLTDRNALHVLDARAGVVVDSVGGFWDATLVAANPVQDKFYVADDQGLLVYDGATNQAVDTLDVWPELPNAFAFSPGGQMVHVVTGRGARLIDGVGDSIVGHVPLELAFLPLCFNPSDGMVYGFDQYEIGLVALDGVELRPAAFWPLELGMPLSRGVCCSLENRLFVGGPGLTDYIVFDCDEGAVAARPALRLWSARHDPARHRVWSVDGRSHEACAVDCRTGAVVARVPLSAGADSVCADEAGSRLFVAAGSFAAAVDMVGDSLLWETSLPESISGFGYNRADDRLYCLAGQMLFALDCGDGSVVASIAVPDYLWSVTVSSRSGKVVLAGLGVAIVDCASQSLRRTLAVPGRACNAVYDVGRDRVYLTIDIAYPRAAVAVLDCAGDSIVSLLELSLSSWAWQWYGSSWDWRHGRLFTPWLEDGSVAVIRDTTPIGVKERSLTPNASRITPAATVVRGVLHVRPSPFPLPEGEGQRVRGQSVLLDVTGRKVMDLKAGENDVSWLAPGVYFVRKWGQGTRGEGLGDKVVITR